jgi:hypothetical protein
VNQRFRHNGPMIRRKGWPVGRIGGTMIAGRPAISWAVMEMDGSRHFARILCGMETGMRHVVRTNPSNVRLLTMSEADRRKFLHDELFSLTLMAVVQRGKVYTQGTTETQRRRSIRFRPRRGYRTGQVSGWPFTSGLLDATARGPQARLTKCGMHPGPTLARFSPRQMDYRYVHLHAAQESANVSGNMLSQLTQSFTYATRHPKGQIDLRPFGPPQLGSPQ